MTFSVVFYRGLVIDAMLAKNSNANAKELQLKWDRISAETKKSAAAQTRETSVPCLTMGIFCYDAGNTQKATEAIRLDKEPERKIQLLIDLALWKEAAEELFVCKAKLDEDVFNSFIVAFRNGDDVAMAFLQDAQRNQGRKK